MDISRENVKKCCDITIKHCSEQLSHRRFSQGAALRIKSPLLSIFLGKDAELQENTIKNAYRDCWQNSVDNLRFVGFDKCSSQTLSELSGEMLALHSQFSDMDKVLFAWYWDIMSDDFDEHIKLVSQQSCFPGAIELQEYFFIFCKQFSPNDREKTKKRLGILTEWANKNNKHLIVQSDFGYAGLVNAATVWKNYRAAANVMVLADTAASRISNEFSFNIQNNAMMWSMGSHSKLKPADDIVCVSLKQILDEYKRISTAERTDYASFDVKERLCGRNTDYGNLFKRLINEWKLLPPMPNCLRDLPYTPEMEDFLEKPTNFVLFASKSAPKTVNGKKFAAALESVRDVWKCVVDLYYRTPFKKYIDSENNLRQTFFNMLSHKFSFSEMTKNFEDEAKKLRERRAWNINIRTSFTSVEQTLHEEACNELTEEMCSKMAKELSNAMDEVAKAANGFEDIIDAVNTGLTPESDIEESVERAYGDYMRRLIDEKKDCIFNIHPCADVESLLKQLEVTFDKLKQDSSVYNSSLMQHIAFCAKNAGGLPVSVIIGDFFNQDMRDTGNLRTYEGSTGGIYYNYCFMSDSREVFADGTTPDSVGEIFEIPDSNYIERLYIYSVKPELIIF